MDTDVVRKRSQYRIPTALGVPDSKLHHHTTFTPAIVDTYNPTKLQPPVNNLTPMEGTMSQYKTEAQKRYKVHDVQPLVKAKSTDNLPLIDPDTPMEMNRSRDDYFGAVAASNPKAGPPVDSLAPGDGTMKQYKTEAQKRFIAHENVTPVGKAKISDQLQVIGGGQLSSRRSRDDYGDVSDLTGRSTPFKPSTNISNDGAFDFGTDKRTNFQYHDATTTKVGPPSDNIFLPEGTMSQYKTEAQKRYKAYDNVEHVGEVKMPDHIAFGDDNDPADYESEHKKEFEGRAAERTMKARPNTSLAREGHIDWNTHKNSEYQYHDVSRQDLARVPDNLKPLEGKLKGKSETQKQFDWKQAERMKNARPSTAMLNEGDFDWDTNKKTDFKEFDLKNQERMKKKVRPNTAMLNEGDFDWNTNKKVDFKQHDLKKQEKLKVQDTLKPLDGKIKGRSETRRQFEGKTSEKTVAARPSTSMFPDGDFDWETNKNADFRSHNVRKMENRKAEDNLKPLQGKLKDKSVSKKQFVAKQADRTLAARPTTTMIRQRGLSFEEGTTGRRDFKDPGVTSMPQRATHKDSLNLLSKNAKLEGASVSKTTYQNHPRSRSAGPDPRQRFQKTSLALLDGPLEGVSETRSNFDGRGYDGRSQSLDRPWPGGNIELNKSSPFAQKQSTSSYDYKTAFDAARPLKVRIGDHLKPNGGIETETEYRKSFDLGVHDRNDIRAQPGVYETLMTPFGPYAEGKPTKPGGFFQTAAV